MYPNCWLKKLSNHVKKNFTLLGWYIFKRPKNHFYHELNSDQYIPIEFILIVFCQLDVRWCLFEQLKKHAFHFSHSETGCMAAQNIIIPKSPCSVTSRCNQSFIHSFIFFHFDSTNFHKRKWWWMEDRHRTKK
jgi:hypothetical protein